MTDRVAYLSTAQNYYYNYVVEALYNLASKLPMVSYEGRMDTPAATGSLVLTDANMPSKNGTFLNGTIFKWWDYSVAGLNPCSRVVTSHIGTTLTFVWGMNLGPGLAYSVFDGAFPRWKMLNALNQALADIGDIPVMRNVTTVDDQQEYDYADSALIFTGNQIVGVELATSKTAPYNYYAHHHWSMKHDAADGMTLVFDPAHIPAGGYNMRITYLAKHLDLMGHEKFQLPYEADQDGLEICPLVRHERISWAAAVYCLRWKMAVSPEKSIYSMAYQDAVQRAERARQEYPIVWPQHIHHSLWMQGR